MDAKEAAERLKTVCEGCRHPLPGVKAPAYCSGCELPYLRNRVIELQGVIQILVELRGGHVEISDHEIMLRENKRLDMWRDVETRSLHVRIS